MENGERKNGRLINDRGTTKVRLNKWDPSFILRSSFVFCGGGGWKMGSGEWKMGSVRKMGSGEWGLGIFFWGAVLGGQKK